ncbi:MAG: hypothetical protein SFX18_09750 [Pirellulales bacterium]|nr:hypothetical protein [Pirellulales bacterium]
MTTDQLQLLEELKECWRKRAVGKEYTLVAAKYFVSLGMTPQARDEVWEVCKQFSSFAAAELTANPDLEDYYETEFMGFSETVAHYCCQSLRLFNHDNYDQEGRFIGFEKYDAATKHHERRMRESNGGGGKGSVLGE